MTNERSGDLNARKMKKKIMSQKQISYQIVLNKLIKIHVAEQENKNNYSLFRGTILYSFMTSQKLRTEKF